MAQHTPCRIVEYWSGNKLRARPLFLLEIMLQYADNKHTFKVLLLDWYIRGILPLQH